jgi:hypothetical protein
MPLVNGANKTFLNNRYRFGNLIGVKQVLQSSDAFFRGLGYGITRSADQECTVDIEQNTLNFVSQGSFSGKFGGARRQRVNIF